jgi:hypothetical protein
MPLKKESGDRKSASQSQGTSPSDVSSNPQDMCSPEQDTQTESEKDLDSQDEDEEGQEEAEEWLQSMGVGAAEIKKLNSNHGKMYPFLGQLFEM